jgi:hypothetical protein
MEPTRLRPSGYGAAGQADLNRRPADYELSPERSESTQEDPLAPEINDLDDP